MVQIRNNSNTINSERNSKRVPNRYENKNIEKTSQRKNHVNQKTKNQKASKEEKIKIQKKIKFIFSIVLILGIIIGIVFFLIKAPIFNIVEIKVEGNSQVKTERILELSKINLQDNIFLINNGKKDIEKEGYIKFAKIKRRLFNKITIQIEERNKAFALNAVDGYMYIDFQGYILEKVNYNSDNLIVLKNYSSVNLKVGDRLDEKDLEKIQDVSKIIKSMKDSGINEEISTIDIKGKYVIELGKINKSIYVGDTKNLTDKMLYVKGILENTKDIEGDVFVNGDFSKGFQPYFREKEKPVEE